MSPFSRRKAMLGSVLAAVSAAAPAAVADAAPNADAELIATYQQFQALEWRFLKLFYGAGRVEDDDERDVLIEPIHDAQDDLMVTIHGREPTTMDGFKALARAAIIWAPDKVESPDDTSDELTAILLCSLAGQDWVDALLEFKEKGQAANHANSKPWRPVQPGEPGYSPELAAYQTAVWEGLPENSRKRLAG